MAKYHFNNKEDSLSSAKDMTLNYMLEQLKQAVTFNWIKNPIGKLSEGTTKQNAKLIGIVNAKTGQLYISLVSSNNKPIKAPASLSNPRLQIVKG